MSDRWDFEVFDRGNRLVLAVEVKSKLNASTEWAARWRRNMLAHGILPVARYFLMTFPDRFYLWKHADLDHTLDVSEPTYVIDARPIVKPYLDRSGISANQISEQSLELIVASWLNQIIHQTPDELRGSQDWLLDSGLHAAIAGGRLEYEVAV